MAALDSLYRDALGHLDVIRFDLKHENSNGSRALLSVDGTDMEIQKESPFDPELWSHKLNSAGVRYEIGICLRTGLICWVNGPYRPEPWPDLRIFRHRLMGRLDIGEYIVADKGYRDGQNFVIAKGQGPEWLQTQVGKALARHETVNGKLKVFTCMKSRFRHGIERHGDVFNALINIVQLVLSFESPLFEIDYDDTGYDE